MGEISSLHVSMKNEQCNFEIVVKCATHEPLLSLLLWLFRSIISTFLIKACVAPVTLQRVSTLSSEDDKKLKRQFEILQELTFRN